MESSVRPSILEQEQQEHDVSRVAVPPPSTTSLFIVVKRDPFYVAQSLLKAREDVQGDRSIGWGAGADDGLLSPAASPLEQVADQTRRL